MSHLSPFAGSLILTSEQLNKSYYASWSTPGEVLAQPPRQPKNHPPTHTHTQNARTPRTNVSFVLGFDSLGTSINYRKTPTKVQFQNSALRITLWNFCYPSGDEDFPRTCPCYPLASVRVAAPVFRVASGEQSIVAYSLLASLVPLLPNISLIVCRSRKTLEKAGQSRGMPGRAGREKVEKAGNNSTKPHTPAVLAS